MLHFATLFDINYLSRGLALYFSLQNHCKSSQFKLFILALDEATKEYFKRNQEANIIIICLANLEQEYPELKIARNNRSKIEYYFTLSPVLPLYILKKYAGISRITTLDADIYFYSDPIEIFKAYEKESVLITPHDFSRPLLHLIPYGKYNVSFQSFPNTVNGLAVLESWKQKCLLWCKDSLDTDTGYFADQKYLDDWENDYEDVEVIKLKTCSRAPWNIGDTDLLYVDKTLLVTDLPLVYYHFHHLRINGPYIGHGLQSYGLSKISGPIKTMYQFYIQTILKQGHKLQLKDDIHISRNSGTVEKNLLLHLWRKEMGAFVLFNRIVFYDITPIKSIYKKIRIFLNGKFN